jgi:hypothetical protein
MGELIGYVGGLYGFVSVPIPVSGTAYGGSMAVRYVSSSELEVHVLTTVETASDNYSLTYCWSIYTTGSGFGQWQPPIQVWTTDVPVIGSIAVGPNTEVIVAASSSYFVANSPGSTWNQINFNVGPPSTPAMAVDGNGATHLINLSWPAPVSPAGSQPTLKDSIFPQGITTSAGVQGIVIDAPQQPNVAPIPPDPLGWDGLSWGQNCVQVGSSVSIRARQAQICPGMIVRSSGEVDFALYNYPFSQIAFFWLTLGATAWGYNSVGSVPYFSTDCTEPGG